MDMVALTLGASGFAVLFLAVVAAMVIGQLRNPRSFRASASLQIAAFLSGYAMLALLGLIVYSIRVTL